MKKALFIFLALASIGLYGQSKDIRAAFRLDYYMEEPTAEFVVCLPEDSTYLGATVRLTSDSGQMYSTLVEQPGGMVGLEVPIADLAEGSHRFQYAVQTDKGMVEGLAELKKLPYKFNAVQVDRKTGGVIARGMPLIPYGFYCYSPVQPMIQEEEVVRGFNLISPYQSIPNSDRKMRKVYMDRAAELGMKVNYNLLSVATAGTGYNRNQDPEERRQMFIEEIKAFKDHPALLSWYLADEPDGRNTPVEVLRELYQLIKSIDPYHPVSIVFMHYGSERKYIDCYDISMGDLYPVPTKPVAGVAKFQKSMSDALQLEKGIWLVPQSFGGNEWWTREPTAGEIRASVYMGLLNGSRGFQFFIRHGQNGFPKSTTAWGEAAAVALEVAEMTPYVLSGQPAPKVAASDSMVEARAWTRGKNMMIAAVNKENTPKDLVLQVEGWDFTGELKVPFENRTIQVRNGVIEDKIDALGSRVYKLEADPVLTTSLDSLNVVDPSFEANTSVGVPNAVYAQVGKGRGSTYFVDSRTAHTGEHSLRLITHKNGEGVTLQHFPIIVDSARTYTLSFWAKAGAQEEFPQEKNYVNARGKVKVEKIRPVDPVVNVTARLKGRTLVDENFTIDSPQWKRYQVDVYVQQQPGKGREGITLNFRLDTRAMIWMDDICFTPKE